MSTSSLARIYTSEILDMLYKKVLDKAYKLLHQISAGKEHF